MKKELDNIRNTLNSNAFKVFVYKRMEEIQSLSSKMHGILAGQSIASMAVEFLDISNINVVYNDIDIFRFVSRYEILHKTGFYQNLLQSISEKNNRIFQTNNLDTKFNNIITDLYSLRGDQSNYATYSRVLVKLTGISILHTMRKELLNYIFITSNKNYSLPFVDMKNLIDSFDINSTQIGMDIKTGTLYFSEAFVLFLYTKQLEITSFSTPAHSLIRAFKKFDELGVYFDKNQALMTYALQSKITKHIHIRLDNYIKYLPYHDNSNSIYNKIDVEKKLNELSFDERVINLFFGKLHSEKFESTSLVNEVNLLKKTNSSSLLNNGKEFSTELAVNYNFLYFMESKNEESLSSDAINSFKELPFVKEHRLENIDDLVTSFEKIDNTNCTDHNFDQYIYSTDLNLLSDFIVMYQPLYKNFKNLRRKNYHDFSTIMSTSSSHTVNLKSNFNSINYEYVRKIDSLKKKHIELYSLLDFVYVESYEYIYKLLKLLEQKHGSLIYSLLNDSNLFTKIRDSINKDNFDNYLKLSHIEVERLISKNLEPFFEDIFSYECENYKIIELNSGLELLKEGIYQANCIGGYSNEVKNRSTSIFSIRYANGKRVSISVYNTYYYEINSQLMYDYYNKQYRVKNQLTHLDDLFTNGEIKKLQFELSKKEITENNMDDKTYIMENGRMFRRDAQFSQIKDFANVRSSILAHLEPLNIIANYLNININENNINGDYSIAAEDYIPLNSSPSSLNLNSDNEDNENKKFYHISNLKDDSMYELQLNGLSIQDCFSKGINQYKYKLLSNNYVNDINYSYRYEQCEEMPF